MLGSTTSAAAREQLLGALSELRDRAASARLPLDVIGADEARAELSALADQLTDYMLPRVREPAAPLLAVVGGPTGAGKSTLVNSLVGAPVSRADVLRPTTRAPVLVCSPDDAEWFQEPHVLPGLTRVVGSEDGHGPSTVQIVQGGTPAGLALLDSPDIDSVVATNRRAARQLLGAADLWIMVTTAARYADAIPWSHLTTVRDRGTAMATVLNRVPAGAIDDVAGHLAALLDRHGLGDVPIFVVPESPLGPGGLLPPEHAEAIRSWLYGIAANEEIRIDLVEATIENTLDSLRVRLVELAAAADAQVAGLVGLRGQVDDGLRAAIRRFRDSTGDGSLIRGDVLTRWNAFAGAGNLSTSIPATLGRIRARLAAAAFGRADVGAQMRAALAAALVDLVRLVADMAMERIVDGWRGHRAGAALLGAAGISVGRARPDMPERAAAEIASWEAHVTSLVNARGRSIRMRPQFATFGTPGVCALTMVAAVTHASEFNDGDTVAASAGAAGVSRRLLYSAVGEPAARELIDGARRDLAARIEPLLRDEAAHFSQILDSVRVDPALGAWLRCQQAAIEQARSMST